MKYALAVVAIASLAVTTTALVSGRPTNALRAFGLNNSLLTSASTSRTNTVCRMSTSADFVKTEIAAHDVVVFSKSYCPFCKKTKDLFAEKKINAKVYELNDMANGADIQQALLELTGQKTVPNVFIKGVHLGGNDATQAANASGKLDQMLK